MYLYPPGAGFAFVSGSGLGATLYTSKCSSVPSGMESGSEALRWMAELKSEGLCADGKLGRVFFIERCRLSIENANISACVVMLVFGCCGCGLN